MHATKKRLEEAGDKVTDEEKDVINTAVADMEEAIKGDDLADIEAKTKTLSEASSGLAQKMQAEQQAQADAGEGAAGAGDSGNDDAVDAEFEEVIEEAEKETEEEDK